MCARMCDIPQKEMSKDLTKGGGDSFTCPNELMEPTQLSKWRVVSIVMYKKNQ